MTSAGTGTAGESATGREQLRSHIVEVAARLLTTGGREAVSTRAVAAAAGTQAPTIYRLFGDKAGLLAAVAEHGYASYLAAKPHPRPSADPVDQLRAGWDLHIEFGLANPGLFTLMYGDPQPGHPSAAAAEAFRILKARIGAIATAGRLRVSQQLGADMVHAAACGTVIALLAAPAGQRDAALSDATFHAVITAITTDAGAAPDPGPVPAANALRAHLPDLKALTDGERQLLDEWLARLAGDQPGQAE